MRRIAVFVEGQTELIFVREFLLKWFDYQVDIECRNLLTDERFNRAEYDFPNPTATIHIQVINVGMDGNVLPRILSREQYLYNLGYELIIGLRDMYSYEYRKKVKSQTVDSDTIQRFQQEIINSIQQRAKHPDLIRFCFAIMELETWWIGIPSLWEDVDPSFRQQNEHKFASPESIFHPAMFVDQLFRTKQQTYSKHKGEVESIVGRISREDYVDLHSSQRCPSFCEFVHHVQPKQTDL